MNVAHIAHLARLELSPEELAAAETQLGAVLGYFDSLSAVDTSSVEATLGVQPHNNVFRDDRVRAPLSAAEALANAPQRGLPGVSSLGPENDGFRIPRILDEE
jgi:aspartyl-tRNA(Asn)/glutamyl-tRNA(Gln) amidotransferase subunit C